jgi:hypothetical protein
MPVNPRESAWALDAGGGREGTMDGRMSLDRLQAQRIWEMFAPRGLGKEGIRRKRIETFRRNPAGSKPVRKCLASSRERVLRGAGQLALK